MTKRFLGFDRGFAGLMLAIILVTLQSLLACAVQDPIVAAKGNPELQSQAMYAEYVQFEEAIVRILQDPLIDDKTKLTMQMLHSDVNPYFEALHKQLLLIQHLRVSKPEDVPQAILALNQLLIDAMPLMKTIREVK